MDNGGCSMDDGGTEDFWTGFVGGPVVAAGSSVATSTVWRAKEMVTVYTEGGDVVQRGCTVPRKPGLEKDEWERQLREVEILQMQDDSEWARSSLWKRRNEVSGFTNSKGRGALFHTHLPPSKVSVDMQVCDRDLESLRGARDIWRDRPKAVVRPMRKDME